MMDDFDDFIKKNRSSFDQLEPKFKTWSEQKTELELSKKLEKNVIKKKLRISNSFKQFMKIAAAVLLITSVSLFNLNGSNSNAFEDIALSSPEGTIIPLDPSLNKYTLVQFWESGNVLCSDDNCYYYMPAYEKYKDHGFEIYAISLDENKSEWLDGIEENKLPWIHVSDLKGWDSPLCIECSITKVPTSFLLNHKGEIIKSDLDAEELENTLDELLAMN